MLAKIKSLSLLGLSGETIDIEVDIHRGMPGFTIVGLADTAVQESRHRVRSAILSAGFEFPRAKIAVNLAPADLKKHGPRFDLPIALGILIASEQIRPPEDIATMLFLGELSFTGNVRSIDGVLPSVSEARKKGFQTIFLPAENADEATLIHDIEIFGIDHLSTLIEHLEKKSLKPHPPQVVTSHNIKHEQNMAHIKGQEHAKRALEIAAAGGHNLLMNGPPGSGKTMLAKALRSILPDLTPDEILDITTIHSVAGLVDSKKPFLRERPFRSVHHTASGIAIVGGGNPPKPGEISLAHRGVLFLDEFAEFPAKTLEVLRQPLEDGVITISRAAGSCKFPAQLMLVAAMNPCPCGFATDNEKECLCSPFQIQRYQNKISGPLLDRIDLHLEVSRVPFQKLNTLEPGESSEIIQKRVNNARSIQKKRFAEHKNVVVNAEMSSHMVKQHCQVDDESQTLLKQAMNQLHLSARTYYRILKVARTIADLEESSNIQSQHIAEAIQYRHRG